VSAARRSIEMLELLDARLGTIDLAQLRSLQTRQDSLEAQRLVRRALFGASA
jgi:hypothetical protein